MRISVYVGHLVIKVSDGFMAQIRTHDGPRSSIRFFVGIDVLVRCDVVAFSSERSSVSATSQYVCVCKWGLPFGAYERWAVFPFATVDVYAPCHI